ncbi:Antirestriction protein ArdC (ArdC) [Fructobacillus tropaeoli]|uniref:ArdC-like ssDNA-binding domain-containing protein n=1 Tax=Fructobacillus tropaeoli TaxID=709323 RepID=UPI002DA63B29|nr:Antirestriction protein ArdC (ArdC) [Fructobacillus tropaeoli]
MEVKYLNPKFLAEEMARTGSYQFDLKANRLYVGIYDQKTGWFIPLEGRLSPRAPRDGVFETPFPNHNPHLKRPGLNLQKAIFIEKESALIAIDNTLPRDQYQFIQQHLTQIEAQLKAYTKRIIQLPNRHPNLTMSTVPFYPKGIEKLLHQRVDRFGLEGPVTRYQETNTTSKEEKKNMYEGMKDTDPKQLAKDILAKVQQEPEQSGDLVPDNQEEELDDNLQEIIQGKDTKRLNRYLKRGLSKYRQSDYLKSYLKFAAQFPQYSSRNQRLLHEQAPGARQVASFQQWKNMGNPIKKGAKSLRIWAPVTVIQKDQEGQPVLDENGQKKRDTYYKLVPVFDQTQVTDPKKIVQPVKPIEGELDSPDHPDRFEKAMQIVTGLTTAKVVFGAMPPNHPEANGYFNAEQKTIVLKNGLSQNQTIHTLLHEVAHSRLHQNETAEFGSEAYQRGEFAAESVAFILSEKLGIDTQEYSFGYLDNWTRDDPKLEKLTDVFEQISVEAKTLADQIDERLITLQTQSEHQQMLQTVVQPNLEETKEAQSEVTKENIPSENLTQAAGPKM